MRVALLGPITWRTPPDAYGPWEQVVSLLADGLAARGLDVTLFATLDSKTTAELDGVCPHPYGGDVDLDGRVWEAMHVAYCMARSGEFDLVHSHLDWLPLAMVDLCRAPLLTTVHGFSSPRILPAYRMAAARGARFVAISDADRVPDLPYLATVHHGIDLTQFPFRAVPDDYLLAFGRIHPDKGTAAAIDIARRAGRPLVIAGPVQDTTYHATQVAPHIDGQRVRYVGNVGGDQRARLLGGATALLHPVGFAEPFGLSVVEAMACGTPVIGYPRGALPELIEPGRTGFLPTDPVAAAEAVPLASLLDRAEIRRTAVARFGADRMVDDYLQVYERACHRTVPA
jgi:glycosyltransferase involved in cell wall biosynthesis